MPPEILDDDEDYASSEDSDFAPEDGPEHDAGPDSSDEDDSEEAIAAVAKPVTKKRKRAAGDGDGDGDGDGGEAVDAGLENSGDEAIIEKGKKRHNKGRKAQLQLQDQDQHDEGGEGGLIKTRSMRAVEKAECKAKPIAGPVTIDVDALWASMTAAPVIPTRDPPTSASHQDHPSSKADSGDARHKTGQAGEPKEADMIKIKRTYKFAGKTHTEEKLVPRESAEARLYLASRTDRRVASGHDDDDDKAAEQEGGEPARYVPRKVFRSVWEPVLVAGDGHHQQRTDLNLAIAVRLRARDEEAKKLNTVEKSRMDWAGFVDKEGIKDDLVLAGKAKGSFANQQDFLARTEARREEDARRVRLAKKG